MFAKHLTFGFLISILSGLFFQYAQGINLLNFSPSIVFLSDAGYSAIAVACTVTTLCVSRIYHPPAIGLTMGLVLENWDHEIFYVIIIGCFVLVVFSFIQALAKQKEYRQQIMRLLHLEK